MRNLNFDYRPHALCTIHSPHNNCCSQNLKIKWTTGLVWLGAIIISSFFCFMTRRGSIFAREKISSRKSRLKCKILLGAVIHIDGTSKNDLLVTNSEEDLIKFGQVWDCSTPDHPTGAAAADKVSTLVRLLRALSKLKQNFQSCCCWLFYQILRSNSILSWMGPWNTYLSTWNINWHLMMRLYSK